MLNPTKQPQDSYSLLLTLLQLYLRPFSIHIRFTSSQSRDGVLSVTLSSTMAAARFVSSLAQKHCKPKQSRFFLVGLCYSASASLPVNFFPQQHRPCYLQAGLLQRTPLRALFEDDLDALAGAMCVFLATSEFASFCWTKVCPCFVSLGKTIWYPGTGFVEDCLLMGCGQLATWYLSADLGTFQCPAASPVCCFISHRYAGFLSLPGKFHTQLVQTYDTSLPTVPSVPGTEEGLENIFNLTAALPVSLPNSSRVLASCHLHE